MASLKAEKPAGSLGQVKKEPAKAPPASKSAPKKVEQKPREPRKKVLLLNSIKFQFN